MSVKCKSQCDNFSAGANGFCRKTERQGLRNRLRGFHGLHDDAGG
jgi:hypothetical protein